MNFKSALKTRIEQGDGIKMVTHLDGRDGRMIRRDEDEAPLRHLMHALFRQIVGRVARELARELRRQAEVSVDAPKAVDLRIQAMRAMLTSYASETSSAWSSRSRVDSESGRTANTWWMWC